MEKTLYKVAMVDMLDEDGTVTVAIFLDKEEANIYKELLEVESLEMGRVSGRGLGGSRYIVLKDTLLDRVAIQELHASILELNKEPGERTQLLCDYRIRDGQRVADDDYSEDSYDTAWYCHHCKLADSTHDVLTKACSVFVAPVTVPPSIDSWN